MMATDLSFKIFFFGSFKILINESPVNIDNWKSKKALELLKYLVYKKGQKVSKEYLLEFLWPESKSDLHNLHTVIYYIRKKLREITCNREKTFIYYNQGYYFFDNNIVKYIDCFEMEKLYKSGIRIEKNNPENALEEYKKALSIYTDHFLVNDIYQDWTMNIRQNYIDIVSQIIIRMVNILSVNGDDYQAINICKCSLKYKLYNEEIYYNLIKLLIKNGSILEATEFYQEYSRFVFEEYEMEVSGKFYNLFEDNVIYFKKDKELQYNKGVCDGPFLCDKRLFNLLYKLAIKRVKRYNEYFSLIYIEIKGNFIRELKQYLIHICRKKLREGDILCHWGHQSLLLQLHMVGTEECYKIQERLSSGLSKSLLSKLSIKIISVDDKFIKSSSCVFLTDMLQ